MRHVSQEERLAVAATLSAIATIVIFVGLLGVLAADLASYLDEARRNDEQARERLRR